MRTHKCMCTFSTDTRHLITIKKISICIMHIGYHSYIQQMTSAVETTTALDAMLLWMVLYGFDPESKEKLILLAFLANRMSLAI